MRAPSAQHLECFVTAGAGPLLSAIVIGPLKLLHLHLSQSLERTGRACSLARAWHAAATTLQQSAHPQGTAPSQGPARPRGLRAHGGLHTHGDCTLTGA